MENQNNIETLVNNSEKMDIKTTQDMTEITEKISSSIFPNPAEANPP